MPVALLTTDKVLAILREAVSKGCYVEHDKSAGTAKAHRRRGLGVPRHSKRERTARGSAGSSTPSRSPGPVRRSVDPRVLIDTAEGGVKNAPSLHRSTRSNLDLDIKAIPISPSDLSPWSSIGYDSPSFCMKSVSCQQSLNGNLSESYALPGILHLSKSQVTR